MLSLVYLWKLKYDIKDNVKGKVRTYDEHDLKSDGDGALQVLCDDLMHVVTVTKVADDAES